MAGIDLRLDSGFEQSRSDGDSFAPLPSVQFKLTQKVEADWTLSLLPRVGWAWDKAHVYVTAGIAASRVSLTTSYQDNYITGGVGPATGSSKASKTMTGGAIGFGGDYALDKAASISLQYLYTDFGTLHNTTSVTHPSNSIGNRASIDSSVELRNHTLMVGYTYRFKD